MFLQINAADQQNNVGVQVQHCAEFNAMHLLAFRLMPKNVSESVIASCDRYIFISKAIRIARRKLASCLDLLFGAEKQIKWTCKVEVEC